MLKLFFQCTDGGIIVNKGTHPSVDSYSAFWDNNRQSQTDLVKILSKHKVTDVYVCGVAYDVCVGELLQALSAWAATFFEFYLKKKLNDDLLIVIFNIILYANF